MRIPDDFAIKIVRIKDDGGRDIIAYFKILDDAECAIDAIREVFDDCVFELVCD